MEKVLALVRELVDPPVWSAGVELARNATFQEELRSEPTVVERVFRILRGPRDSIVSVTISDSNELWQCDCNLEEDPCRHVVATILAVKQGKVVSSNQWTGGRRIAGVEHCFSRVGTALRFERFVVIGETRIAVAVSLLKTISDAQRDGARLLPADSELAIDHVLPQTRRGILEPKEMRYLIPALSRVAVVSLDGEPVTVSAEPLPVIAEVVDEDSGFRLRRATLDGVTEVFDNGAALCKGVLHAVEDSALRMDEVEMLRGPGTLFSKHSVGELATRIIPQLQGKIDVRISSRLLPRARRIAPRVVIAAIADSTGSSATVIPRIVYGSPIIAEVKDGELVPLDGREIPIRQPAEEGRLVREVSSKLNLRMEIGTVLRGEQAILFLEKAHGWQVQGDAVSVFRPLAELVPTMNFGDSGLTVSFVGVQGKGATESIAAVDVVQAWRQGARYVQLDGGSWAALPTTWLKEHAQAVERIVSARQDEKQVPAVLFSEISELCDSLRVEPPEYFRRLAAGLGKVDSIPDAKLPQDLRADLRSYQHTGVNWISFLHEHNLGALLADDMGLGKTLQALCVVRIRTLVVCPTSVLASWRQQSEMFRPDLKVSLYHGGRREMTDDADLTITSYALLRLDIQMLEAVDWDLVILDEAQTIRNPGSQVAQAAYRLKARSKISLSGTPVENSLDDLWSQFAFLNPGLLGSYRQFQERFVQPIQAGNSERAQELRRRVTPFVMRRLKRDVAHELPPKTEVILHCELTTQEKIVYEAILGMARSELIAKLDSGQSVFSALEVLLRLRQACCHSGLIPGHEATTSSKIELLMESLEASVAQGHRALVFSQWTSLLDRIEPHMSERGVSFCRIDGTTEGRGELVDWFQSEEGPSVMLLSLKAGGLGLTLTAADHVYIVDPWWNPAAEDQAADRAYRIGQKNAVVVHRLVAKDTIEERILQIQHEKRRLLSEALGGTGSIALTREDVLSLLGDSTGV